MSLIDVLDKALTRLNPNFVEEAESSQAPIFAFINAWIGHYGLTETDTETDSVIKYHQSEMLKRRAMATARQSILLSSLK